MVQARHLVDCACFNLRKAARAITQVYDAALEPSGVRVTQLSVLVALALTDAAPLSRLADKLGMDRTTLTRNLRPLQRRGWVRIQRGASDRRERSLSLTRSGRAVLEQAMPLWENVQNKVLQRLGPRWPTLLGDLRDLASGEGSLSGTAD
jgi:DNA-binding MarR family transcriptional regulator